MSPVSSNLFAAARNRKATIYAVFGGQGNDEFYFNGLRQAFRIYRPLVSDLVETCAGILRTAAVQCGFGDLYPHGVEILDWLNDPSSTPDNAYLISAPISFPLIRRSLN